MSPAAAVPDPTGTTAAARVASGLAPLRSISLGELLATAELQTRRDDKFLVPLDALDRLLEVWHGRLRALTIDGSRLFRYESVYFDTSELTTYRQHAHGRRRRVKVRTRTYLDSEQCLLELKFVGSHGETVKDRYPHPIEQRFELSEPVRTLLAQRLKSTVEVGGLRPVISTRYRRATMVDVETGNRITCDVDLHFCDDTHQRSGPTGVVVLESKALAPARALEAELHLLGLRPLSLSKYCVGMALLDPRLPANRWNRELRRHFDWTPVRSRGAS
jgi:hypothetical protein